MPGVEESLFSLELVVEKVYVPHVCCRFPAVAFRLLDFPTIVINHVEADLAKAIRRQISFDPDYEIPQQFSELKDRHGNFMVKKGKSCLFKMVADTLKNHLANTPLYVMVIDMFPETPKLVGNSTVPLNVLINAICADLIRLGSTVPSVHGDKGLFKIYNLMGKEIGYFVLGFRLLCLGPSLIPHLPEAALVQRQSKKQTKQQRKENKQMVEMVQMSAGEDQDEEEDDLIETRNTASMTDVIKHDVFMQTVEMDNKAVHVEMQTPAAASESVPSAAAPALAPVTAVKTNYNVQTQTDKKGIKTALDVKKKVLEDLAALEEAADVDEVIVTNIVCPPPLFYNSKAKPVIEVDHDDSYSLDTDMSVSDELTVDSITDEEADDTRKPVIQKVSTRETVHMDMGAIVPPPEPRSYENVPLNIQGNQNQVRTGLRQKHGQGQSVPSQSSPGFPLLSALISELLCIQNPSLVPGVPGQLHTLAAGQGLGAQRTQQLAPETVAKQGTAAVPTTSKKHDQESTPSPSLQKEVQEAESKESYGRRGHRDCAHPEPGVPKDKSWLRVVPQAQQGIKKNSSLTFGLTHTQRLRLKKTNPGWLRNMERKASKRGVLRKSESRDEFNATNLSDTLTEVRRQAQKELEKTAASDTLKSVKDLNNSGDPFSTPKRYRSKSQSRSPPKKRGPSSGGQVIGVPSPRPRHKRYQKMRPQSDRHSSDDSDQAQSARPMSVEINGRHIDSPDLRILPPPGTGDMEDVPVSARSDLPSSRSRSIEVRLPSAQANRDDMSEATISDSDDEDDALPLPDDSFSQDRQKQPLGFPSYLRQGASLPDSIDGRPNQSLNTTTGMDENSPLESTRNSKVLADVGESRNMQSTDDYDTKQFHSTSEPELQELVSDEENDRAGNRKRQEGPDMRFPVINPMLSQQSPVPSTRHSVAKLDLSRSQLPITPGGERTPRSSRSGSPKRPTPRPRRPLKDWRESIHTDSVSSYMPSDPDIPASFSSGEGNYSEDFLEGGSGASTPSRMVSDKPHLIPSAKLGYTIH